MTASRTLDLFVDLSADLTGFDAIHLVGTGNAALFHATLEERAGGGNAAALLDAYEGRVRGAPDPARALRIEILGEARLGPMARNLIRLWYSGTWRRMPQDWRETFAPGLPDGDIIPAQTAYTEGLLWPAIGANPPGAKPFGYAMWARPPRVTLD
jgi:hypothetical protein